MKTAPMNQANSLSHSNPPSNQKESLGILALGALGVVYGDIGTSPLYAVRESFAHHGNIVLSPENILGVLSLIFWTLIVIICAKYMVFIMRADNKGEGGILSLLALSISREKEISARLKKVLIFCGVAGTALLYGDGLITPAISVLSAVEGIKIVTDGLEKLIVPFTLAIIIALFMVQQFGTAKIGVVFGPIIMLWFTSIGVIGFLETLNNPQVWQALNPVLAVQFLFSGGWTTFVVLGTIFLVVTGGEALYADMGHFGKKPIRLAWFLVAMPGLVLNYFGQGALLLRDPTAIINPFYKMVPESLLIPMVVLATMASVIASQALISGVFSITRQAVQLGFIPRLRIIHTSSREIGQIYIPIVNWMLMIGVLWIVIAFRSSSSLAAAYGIAVTGTMVITTLLAFEVSRSLWKWPLWKSLSIFGVFLVIDFAFLSTNLFKIEDGGWLPLVVGILIYTLMSIWKEGRRVLAEKLKARSIALVDFISSLKEKPPMKVKGTAVYMVGDTWSAPIPLIHSLKHNKILHERVAVLTIKTLEVPTVDKDKRVQITGLHEGFYQIIAYYGYMETPKMKHILEACREAGIPFKITETTFVLGRETILPSTEGELPLWKEKVFAFLSRNAERPTAFFRIPPNQVIEVGIQVEI